jgi:hypothetical protein
MFINLSFGASVSTTARTVISSVAQFFQDQFSDPITINISVAFGNIGGLGSSSYNLANQTYSYSQIKTALSNDATSSDDVSAVSSLLAADPITGTHSWNMTPAEAKALGLIAGNGTASDGSMTFSNTAAFDYDRSNGITTGQYDFYGVVAHEMTEVMGRQTNAIGNNVATGAGYHPLDLFKYASATNHSFTGTQFGYFSVNNGFSDLNPNFNTDPNGDFGDWANSEAGDSFRAFSDSGVVNAVTTADLVVMDAIGFTRTDDYISTTATTGQVAVGSSTTGNVNYLRDHDWIRVQLTAGVQYTIDEQGQSVGAGTLSDPFLALYSAAGQLITSDDDSGGNRNSRIVYSATTTGAYYIDAGAFDNEGTGTYRVSVSSAPLAGSVAINDVTLSEGSSGTKVATFTVTRSGGTAAFAVNYFTSDGGATTADNDYVASSGTLNFGAGVNTQTISVTINGDTKFESDEAFFVNLSGATNGATISDNLGIGTITNDDAAPAGSVSINDVTISEGNSGAKVATFTVTRSGGTAAFAINFTTSDGGATTSDNDYVANAGTLNFGAGVNTQSISVTINGDTKFESDEAFFVNLSGATNGATISDNLGIGTITNDDAAPAGSISINDMTISEGSSGTKIETFTVTRSGGTGAFAVNFATADNSATVADHDYVANAGTLNFAAGVNTQQIQVTINGDPKFESVETFFVNLSGATNGASISDGQGIGTITNDDALFAAAKSQFAAFAPDVGGWNSDNQYPRELADVNGDGFADIVGFGQSGVYVSLATGGGNFGPVTPKLAAFAPDVGGWNSQDRYPRQLADVNGDHMADIVGFGQSGVYVSLGTGGGNFGPATPKLAAFAPDAGGWNSDNQYPRELADVNGDGLADIVGFGQSGVYVSLATGGGNFGPATPKLAAFAPDVGGWISQDRYPRHLADVNGDHMADIVGFGEGGVYVALATGGGNFGPASFKFAAFAPAVGGWYSDDRYPRELADVNHDGMADIVGFGEDGVYISLATGGGNFAPASFEFRAFAPTAGGWNGENQYPRYLADINHDGLTDIVGFGQSGVFQALNDFHLV